MKAAATAKSDDASAILERADRLATQTAECRSTYNSAANALSSLERELIDAGSAHNSEYDKLQRLDRSADEYSEQALKVEVLSKKYDAVWQKHDSTKQRMVASNAELQRLEHEAGKFGKGICVSAVLDRQELVEKASGAIAEVEHLIQEQEALVATANASIPPFDSKNAERQDLLAAIAAGAKSSADLKAFDSKIAENRKAFESAHSKAEPEISNAQATIAGLHRRLSNAKEHHASMREGAKRILRVFLRSEAERIASEYIEHATAVRDRLCQLRGLELVMKHHAGFPQDGYHGNFTQEFWLPTLQLSAFEGKGSQGVLFSHNSEASTLDAAGRNELARLQDLGVAI